MSPRSRRRRATDRGRTEHARDVGAVVAVSALAAALAGTALVVDPWAESAFDAPKRLVAVLFLVVAAAALVLFTRRGNDRGWSWQRTTGEQRVALVGAAFALAVAAVSAGLSPRRGVALDALRLVLLLALCLPLGASRALDRGRSTVLLLAFVGACAVNAAVSALQYAGVLTLFRVAVVGGRLDVSAFVGNDGVLALALALACVACAAVALHARASAIRAGAVAGVVLFVAGLAVNQSLTALTSLAAGGAVLAACLPRRRAAVAAVVLVLALGAFVVLHPALSRRAHEALGDVGPGRWDRVLTYRPGPWAAAAEMVKARPLTGWGPGTFGAEFVPHRLQAEIVWRRRFVNPFLTGAYVEAHSDYLQMAAEVGLPAVLAALIAAGALASGLWRLIGRAEDESARREAIVLLALLCAGGVAALTWFPFQRPLTAVPLVLAAGRAFRVLGRRGAGDDP